MSTRSSGSSGTIEAIRAISSSSKPQADLRVVTHAGDYALQGSRLSTFNINCASTDGYEFLVIPMTPPEPRVEDLQSSMAPPTVGVCR